MRTNVEIDDRLMRQGRLCRGLTTKQATVEMGLRMPGKTCLHTSIRRLRGKVRWEGDLARSRLAQRGAKAGLVRT